MDSITLHFHGPLTFTPGERSLFHSPLHGCKGIQAQTWPGLWRDRSPEGPGRLLQKYSTCTRDVLKYVEALAVFVAQTNVDTHLRKHLEGSIGWNLRNNHQDKKGLYPDDNHVGTGPKVGTQLRVSSDVPIAGIDSILEI